MSGRQLPVGEEDGRPQCGCGRYHVHFTFEGARVYGCPVCLTDPVTAKALKKMMEALREHYDKLKAKKEAAKEKEGPGGEREPWLIW